MHACMYIRMLCMYIYIYMYDIFIYTYIQDGKSNTCSNITTRKWIIHMYEYTYVCMYVCIYTYVCTYIHVELAFAYCLGILRYFYFYSHISWDATGPAAHCQALAVFFIHFLFLFL